ncbi:hypothetical protein AX774_g4640 [Zancudomyces culisetae]|uniref:Uncharacterized protein n=1 Tax=Zancudomyces culisetae TaxID=1213189 RepID=A0A1R1PLR1_ZANCU|nr:hypothetical protein AX774_g4640 [Zancudomyces culisetae]|eukprot:OMH81896.1 hypothetical protein AX774_g4640 [Zancudomyces culisetae]
MHVTRQTLKEIYNLSGKLEHVYSRLSNGHRGTALNNYRKILKEKEEVHLQRKRDELEGFKKSLTLSQNNTPVTLNSKAKNSNEIDISAELEIYRRLTQSTDWFPQKNHNVLKRTSDLYPQKDSERISELLGDEEDFYSDDEQGNVAIETAKLKKEEQNVAEEEDVNINFVIM